MLPQTNRLRKEKDIKTLFTKGKSVFVTNCAACHGQNAEGKIGPNLTDEYWMHGPNFSYLIRTITKGIAEKGMPAWEQILKPDDLRAVASYVVSLQGSKPADPKAPQGDKFDAAFIRKE